jgi:hypothetical protein
MGCTPKTLAKQVALSYLGIYSRMLTSLACSLIHSLDLPRTHQSGFFTQSVK